MPLFLFVEPGDTLQSHVIGLGSARSEHDILGVRSDQVCNVLDALVRKAYSEKDQRTYLTSILNCLFSLPSIRVRPRVWVTVLICKEREHCIQDARVHRSSGLIYL